jgi:cytochrome c biogenesis protein CcmG, thiol:disulfide interchange protein DsbE
MNARAGGNETLGREPSAVAPVAGGLTRRRLLYILPATGFAGLAVALAWGLGRDPTLVPSSLIGKPVPVFNLPPVQGRQLGLASANLRGKVSLVDVFASWCVAFRAEHPLLMGLASSKAVPIHGLNYKDKPQDAAQWLDSNGDPYRRTGADRDGRVSVDWGVYGVPETYVVGADGRIPHKQVGPLTEKGIEERILPLVKRLRAQAGNDMP